MIKIKIYLYIILMLYKIYLLYYIHYNNYIKCLYILEYKPSLSLIFGHTPGDALETAEGGIGPGSATN